MDLTSVVVVEAALALWVPQELRLRVALAERVHQTHTPVPLLLVRVAGAVARTVAPLARGVPVAVVLVSPRVVLPLLPVLLTLVVVGAVMVALQLTLMLVLVVAALSLFVLHVL